MKAKTREGSKVTKKYHPPATPHERLLADQRVSEENKQKLRETFATLDPVYLLSRIRERQRKLSQQQVRGAQEPVESARELSHFIKSLSTAWRSGEVRPTHRKPNTGPRAWRTRADPFQHVWPLLQQWLND